MQLSALPQAPFHGCVLDSYTVGRGEGGIICAEFTRAFTAERRAVGLWITKLTPGGPSVALGAATPRVSEALLWYWRETGIPGITRLARIPVGRHLASMLGATSRFSYLAGAVPPDTDLCEDTLVGGLALGRAFGPSAFLDTTLITRTEGDGNLTETPNSQRCPRRLNASNPLSALARMLSPAVSGLVTTLGG